MEEPKEIEKAEGTNINKNLGITLFLILASFAAFFLILPKILDMVTPDPYETVYYNNFKFEKIDGLWYTQWQKGDNLYTIPLRYNPYEVEDVPIVGELTDEFNQPEVYIAFDPTQGNFSILSIAAAELSLNLYKALLVQPIAACSVNDTDTCIDRPVISTNCTENDKPGIFIRDIGKPAILLEGKCIYLGGEGFDLLKSVDRLLYQWYGII